MTISQRQPFRAADPTDPQALRRAFGSFATGVTVVTVGGDTPHGMTANSFSSVSLDPPLLLVSVAHSAVMHRLLAPIGTFGVSVLAADQQQVAKHFANRLRPLGLAQFDAVGWRPGPMTGAPLIDGALAQFECELWRSYPGGDHTIVVGRLLAAQACSERDGLLFAGGRFRQVADEQRTELAA